MLYVLVVGVMMGTVHHSELGGSDVPFIFVADRLFGDWGRWAAITATIMASLLAFSVTLGAGARLLYALGRDGHFPRFFARLHPRFQTPLCRLIEQRYNAPVYQGDGTQRELLDQVGADNVDATIAASDDDGRNVIAALQAKRLGMGRVMAVVQDPEYVPLLAAHDIDAISAPWATAAMVENYLERPGVAELFEIGSGVASLVSVLVPKGAEVEGTQIREIPIPQGCVVTAVIRGEQFVVPRGDTEIRVGDNVVFVGPTSAIKPTRDIFLATKE